MKEVLPLLALALLACEGPEKFVAGAAGAPSGQSALTWTDCGTFVPPDDNVESPRDQRQVFGVSISPDGDKMVITDVRTATAYRIAPNFQESTPLWQSDTGLPLASEFSPDGSVVAISGDGRQLLAADTGASLFRPIPPPGVPLPGCNQAYFRFSHDGGLVAGAGYDFAVEIFDVSGSGLVATLPSQGCDSAAAFSPDDSLLATGKPELYRTSDHTRIWPAVISQDEPDPSAWATWVQFLGDGHELAVSTCRTNQNGRREQQFDCSHTWYSVETGEVTGKGDSSTASFAVLSPDSRFYVDSDSVHDRLRGEDSLLRPEGDIQAAAFAPNRDIIAAVAGGSVHRFCAN